MIPTFNPRADYLEDTFDSVLQPDPGAEQMQIKVVDNCSTDVFAEKAGWVGTVALVLSRTEI